MFPAVDRNSFTVPHSDQFLLYSTLLDDADIDEFIHNPYSPISFYDQNMAHPLFFRSDSQQLELQNNPLVQQHEEEDPVLTAFEEFTMADTSGNNRTSVGEYSATENFHHNGLASDPTNGISSSAAGGMKIYDELSKNVSLSKKDRHSKINTAQGPRDRRMRLSLDIAKRFFGLQDILGFDKASKTVDWLLSKSQSEIKKVAGSKTHDGNNVATKSSDSFGASECCEEVSEVTNKEDISQSGEMGTNMVNKKSSAKTKKKSKGKLSMSLRNGFNNLAKESREKARARARERTKEKMMLRTSHNHNKQDDNANQLSNMDPSIQNRVTVPYAYSFVDQGHTLTNQEESLANTLPWNPSSSCTFNNLPQQISGISHQLPFEDQFYAKPWETYN